MNNNKYTLGFATLPQKYKEAQEQLMTKPSSESIGVLLKDFPTLQQKRRKRTRLLIGVENDDIGEND